MICFFRVLQEYTFTKWGLTVALQNGSATLSCRVRVVKLISVGARSTFTISHGGGTCRAVRPMLFYQARRIHWRVTRGILYPGPLGCSYATGPFSASFLSFISTTRISISSLLFGSHDSF